MRTREDSCARSLCNLLHLEMTGRRIFWWVARAGPRARWLLLPCLRSCGRKMEEKVALSFAATRFVRDLSAARQQGGDALHSKLELLVIALEMPLHWQ